MRTKLLSGILFFLLLINLPCICISTGKPEEKPSLDKSNLENQFKYVIDESSNYNEYKVIKSWWINKLRNNVLDSVRFVRKELIKTQKLVIDGNEHIDSLVKQLRVTENNLNNARAEKNAMKFFGINISKSGYVMIMRFIITILGASVLLFFFCFKRSNSVAARTQKDLNDSREELELFRRNALEREQKIVRKLYDEINKYKRLCGDTQAGDYKETVKKTKS